MTCFNILLIVSPETENIELKVKELMNPYYSYLEVAPYKEYLKQEELQKEVRRLKENVNEIATLAQKMEVNIDNIENLAKANLDWSEEEIDGNDQRGDYKIVDYNPRGKWDWYRFLDKEEIEPEKFIYYPCKVRDIPYVMPYAVITPDGKWNELGEEEGLRIFAAQLEDKRIIEKKQERWKQEVQRIKITYSNHLAIALMCHD